MQHVTQEEFTEKCFECCSPLSETGAENKRGSDIFGLKPRH